MQEIGEKTARLDLVQGVITISLSLKANAVKLDCDTLTGNDKNFQIPKDCEKLTMVKNSHGHNRFDLLQNI